MRKHFLILMLLTLLPLASWADVDMTTAVVTWTSPTDDLAYTAEKQELPVPKKLNGTINIDPTTVQNLKWYVGEGTTGTEIVAEAGKFYFTNAGKYTCTFEINLPGYNGTATGTFEVAKYTIKIEADDMNTAETQLTFGDEVPTNFTWKYDETSWPDAIKDIVDAEEKAAAIAAAKASINGKVTFSTTYTKGSDKGDAYKITPIITGLTSTNYNFTPVDGTLKVVAKAITLTPADFTINVTDKEYNATEQKGDVTIKDLVLDKNLVLGTDFNIEYYLDEECASAFTDGAGPVYFTKAELEAISTAFNDPAPADLSGLTDAQRTLLTKVCNPATPYTNTTPYAAAMKTAVDAAIVACGTGANSQYVKTPATSNHINVGTYYAKVIGAGNYTDNDDVVKPFRITKAPLLIKTKGNATDNPGTHKKDYDGSLTTITAANNSSYLEQQGWKEAYAFDFNVAKLKVSLTPVTGSADGDAGNYTLVVSANGVAQSALYDNYQVTFSNKGSYTIAKKALTFRLANQYISYDAENPFATVKSSKDYLTAAVNPGTGFSVATYPTIQAVAVDGAGEYNLELNENAVIKQSSGEKLDKTANFAITYTGAKLIVEGGTISIIPEDASFTYGDKAPEIKFDIEGMRDADNTDDLRKEIKKYISYNSDFNAGPHNAQIVVNKAALQASDYYKNNLKNNYPNINVFTANYTIAKRQLTKIEVKDQSVNKDDYLNPTGAQSGLVKSSKTVVFTADKYTITEADYNKLMTEYVFVNNADITVTGGQITAVVGDNPKFGILAVGGFSNFAVPADVDLTTGITAVEGKYSLGALTLSAVPVGITIDANVDDDALLAAINGAADVNVGKKNNVTISNRSFTTNTWAVMVLPFETTVREISQKFGYAVVDVLDTSKGDGNNIYFKLHMGTIKANQPFMVKTDALFSGNLAFIGVTTAKVAAETTPVADRDIDAGGTKFIGLYQQKELQGDKQLWLSGAGKWGYNKNNNKVPVGATRAYLQLPEESTGDARIFIEEPDGSTTAISIVAADETVAAKDGWYTLNGVKLNDAPVEKGVYINNGKKVVIK